MTLTPDVASIELATLDAVSPTRVERIGDWLAALDPGTIGRAHSAVPLHHGVGAESLAEIEDAYGAAGLPPVFRLADCEGLAGVAERLKARRYRPTQPTMVEIAPVKAMAAAGSSGRADLADRPWEGWGEVFSGPGFDPADGAHRVAALSRAGDAVFAGVRDGDATLAVGVMAFGHGWASIHGMRTRTERRGEGLAGRILSTFADAALGRGVERVFLQVEEGNPARRLYRRFGFEPAWRYHYWRQDT